MVRKGTCQSEKVTSLTENEQCSEKCSQESHVGDISNDQKRDEKSLRAPQKKLRDLTESQQKIAMKMMTEQAESLAQNLVARRNSSKSIYRSLFSKYSVQMK